MPALDLAACLLYFPVLWITKALGPMEKGPKFTALSIWYNGVMTAFSFVSMIVAADFATKNWNTLPQKCGQAYAENPIYAYTVLGFYLSKYLEWFDTIFLLLRSKPASFLHQFHHIGAPVAVGLLWHTQSESAWIFLGLNGAVHTVMYGYYLLCIFGINIKFIRQWITNMQLLQFVTGFGTLWVIYEKQLCGDWHRFCFWYQYGYVGIVLCLFLNFYIQSYVLKPKRSKKAVDEKKDVEESDKKGAAKKSRSVTPKGKKRSATPKRK